MPLLTNITRVMLEISVPDEDAQFLEIPEGDAKLMLQRRETLNLFNSTLQVNDADVASVPDLSSVLNVSQSHYVDVEVRQFYYGDRTTKRKCLFMYFFCFFIIYIFIVSENIYT